MSKYLIVPAEPAHAAELTANMRQRDRDEVMALAGHTAGQAIKTALEQSCEAWTGLADGKVLCMFGVAKMTLLGGAAVPWMLSTDELPKHARPFLRASRHVVKAWSERYDLLINYVDARYDAALKWAKWLGFTVGPKTNVGSFAAYHPIELRG